MKKIFAVLSVLVFSVTIYISAQGPNGGGGGTAYITPSSGSSGASTNAVNVFTAAQHFTGISNVFGATTSSNYFYGNQFYNTNRGYSYAFATFRNPDSSHPYMTIDSGSATQNGGIIVGNVNGTDSLQLDNDGTGKVRIIGGGVPMIIEAGSSTISLQPVNGSTMLGLTSSGATIGLNGSSAHTLNGAFSSVNGVAPFSGSITNVGPGLGSSNVFVYSGGWLTNTFKIP